MSSKAQTRAPRARHWRRVGLASAVLLGVIASGLFIAVIVLRHLERPWVKARIQAAARGAGIELDYTEASVALGSGVHLKGLTLATPGPLRRHAPELLRVGAVDITWALSHLVSRAPHVDTVTVRDVSLVVVLDDSGLTSFDLSPPSPAPAPTATAPPTPRSGLLEALFASPLPVQSAAIEPIKVTLLRTGGGQIHDRFQLDGLRLEAATMNGGLRAAAGTPGSPLALAVRREGARSSEASLRFWLDAAADRAHAEAKLELDLVSQTIDPALASLVGLAHTVAIDAEARFEPSAGKIVIKLTRADAAGKAVHLAGEVDLPDAAAPLLRALEVHGEVPRLLALAPSGLLPVLPSVASGRVDVDAKQVSLSTTPRVLPGGSLRAAVALAGIRLGLRGDAAANGVRMERSSLDVEVRTLAMDLEAGPDGAIAGSLTIGTGPVSLRRPALRVDLDEGSLKARWRELVLDPVALAGKVELDLGLPHVHAAVAALDVDVEALRFDAKGGLTAKPPYDATLGIRATKVRLARARRALFDDALEIKLRLDDLVPGQPVLATRGAAKLEAQLGSIALSLGAAKKGGDAIDYTLALDATQLGAVEHLLGSAPPLPWARMGLRLRSSGRVEPAVVRLRHDTTLELLRPAYGGHLSADEVALALKSDGGLRRHQGDLTVSMSGVRRDRETLGDGRVAGRFAVDLDAATLSAKLDATGAAAPGLNANLQIAFDRARHRLAIDLDAALRKLDPIAPMLAGIRALRGFRVAGLELELGLHGAFQGLVDAIDHDGAVRLAKDPLTATGEAKLAFKVQHLAWQDQDRAVEAPSLTWEGTLRAEPVLRELRADLHLAALHLAVGPVRVDLAELGDELKMALSGDPRQLHLDVEDHLRLRALRQEVVPAYRTADLSLALRASHSEGGVIRIPELRFENRAGGTSVLLQGGLDLGEQRRSLSMRGTLNQDLTKVWSDPQTLLARGSLSTEVQVESGDLSRYRTTSSVRVKDGYVQLPRQKIKLEAVDGEIPIAAEVLFGPSGPRLSRNVEANSYSELRFSDQHPLLSRRSYLSIARVETPWATIAPLAGNLVVDNNLVSLSQLELGVRDGRVTGRAVLAVQGADSKAQLNIRASGVRSSRGEPFDGNAAVGVSVRQRSVQGRAEILRIGRRHLLDLLDLVDPPRSDAAINRVRRALALGYPDQVRLSFNRGFASAKITFGGLAKLLRIEELRGIPMGPIIDRALAPFFVDEEEQ